jgi:hypothetical protein
MHFCIPEIDVSFNTYYFSSHRHHKGFMSCTKIVAISVSEQTTMSRPQGPHVTQLKCEEMLEGAR